MREQVVDERLGLVARVALGDVDEGDKVRRVAEGEGAEGDEALLVEEVRGGAVVDDLEDGPLVEGACRAAAVQVGLDGRPRSAGSARSFRGEEMAALTTRQIDDEARSEDKGDSAGFSLVALFSFSAFLVVLS